MEGTILYTGERKDGLVRATYHAEDEHTLARRIQAAINEADAEGHDVKVLLDEQVGALMEAQGYVSFPPSGERR